MNSTCLTFIHDKRRITRFFTHLIVLALLFFLPEVMQSVSAPHRPNNSTWIFYVKPLLYCVAFYVNYYVIIGNSLEKRFGIWRFVLYNLGLLIAILIAFFLVIHMARPLHPEDFSMARLMAFLLRDIVILVLTISLAVALRMSDKWRRLDRKQQALMVTQREEELKSLKSQLNPHFLFNTLNNIYALIAISPEKAQQAIHDLSSLLRYVLYENNETVKLSQELLFIDNYIKLMKLRLGEGIPIEVTLDAGDSADRMIAPLLFISLVENAFKHGNTGDRSHPIIIYIKCIDGVIHCHISNHYMPGNRSTDTSGIGITNLRRRLDLIYNERAHMETTATPDTYTINLTIDLNNNPKE